MSGAPVGIWSAGSYAVVPESASWLPHPLSWERDGGIDDSRLADSGYRLSAQVRGGLGGEVLHPHPQLVEAARQATPDAAVALATAYNEWLASFVADAPDRYVGVGMIPATGLDDALDALGRCQQLGLPGISLDQPPAGPGTTPADAGEFWAASEGRTVVCLGRDFGGAPTSTEPRVGAGRASDTGGFLVRMAFAGVVDDHPGTRVLLVNQEAGWLPYLLEGADTNYMRTAASRPVDLGDPDALPSEYVRRITWTTIREDRFSVVHRGFLGEFHLCYSAALPSPGCRWPDDEEAAARLCEGLPDDARGRLVSENCRRLFGVGGLTPFSREEIDDFQHPVVA